MADQASGSLLKVLARAGFSEIAPERLGDVAAECETLARRTGDARFAVLEAAFAQLLSWWEEHDRYGGVPTPLVETIDKLVKDSVPTILAHAQPPDGYAAASEFASALADLETGPSDWIARGWLAPHGQ